jgi:hypothetical protein
MGSSQSIERDTDETTDSFMPIPIPQVSQGLRLPHMAYVVEAPVTLVQPPPPVEVRMEKINLPFIVEKNSITATLTIPHSVSIGFTYRANKDINLSIVAKLDSSEVGELRSSLENTNDVSGRMKITRHTVAIDISMASRGPLLVEIRLRDDVEEVTAVAEVHTDFHTVLSMRYRNMISGKVLDLLPLFISRSSGNGETREIPSDVSLCSICLTEAVQIGFLPCGHVCVCEGCADITLSSSANHCPMCRKLVSGKMSISRAHSVANG